MKGEQRWTEKEKPPRKFRGGQIQMDLQCAVWQQKNVVEQHFSKMTFAEAFPKTKEIEAVLESMQENGIRTVEAALESIRLTGSITAYLCKDGIYATRSIT